MRMPRLKLCALAMRRAEPARRLPGSARAWLVGGAVWLGLSGGAAQAQCAAPVERSIALDAAIVVPRDRAAGSVLYAADYPLPVPAPGCVDPARGAGWAYAQTPHPSQAQDIYRTGVDAVGVRVSIDGRPLPATEYAPVTAADGSARGSLRLELIKIDEAGSGGAVRGADLPSLVYRGDGEAGIAARIVFGGAIAVRAATCNTPNLRVALDPVSPAALATVGASAGAKDFDLRLNACPPGIARISYRLDPLGGVADAAASVVALDADASARGLGIQIRDRERRPLAFGVNHLLQAEGIADGGDFRIPLQAAYYRSDAQPPTPGRVSASLTFTISYE
ncbi:fimbrial protein [Lysobacter sp. CA199]|uniref:fimbrial protein n=1 Tax=Lysobacter sp. CA199 TaxID=3455608 RepID=UPI003F8D054D